jgi:serine/threonine protein kinase
MTSTSIFRELGYRFERHMSIIREETDTGEVVEFPATFAGYSYVRTLGCGAFSVVVLVTENATHAQYACKVLSASQTQNPTSMAKFKFEIELLVRAKHENVIAIHELVELDNHVYLVLEYCAHGDLLSHVIDAGQLSFSEIQRLFYELVKALHFIHESGIAHRDVKPENILLDANLHIKLADFGFSRQSDSDYLMETPCGSPFYVAPEIILGESYDGTKSDIWSAGVVLFGLATGALPWTAQNQAMLTYQITNAVYIIPETVDDRIKECILGCMNTDPTARMTAWDLLQSPLLKELSAGIGLPVVRKIRLGAKAQSLNLGVLNAKKRKFIKRPVVSRSSLYSLVSTTG